MSDAPESLGDIVARIVVRLAVKPVDVARRRTRKRAVDEPSTPSLPKPRIAVRKGRGDECIGLAAKAR